MGDERVTSVPAGEAESLLRRFLERAAPATARAYSADLADLARFLDTSVEEAVTSLLQGPEPASRLALEYALALRRRGLAPATVARRLATLRSLLGRARELGMVGWSLELPSAEEVEAALERSREPESPYLFPRHPEEVDRLDLQHFALREALGANFLAPVEAPERVLDVGTGTGQWGFELAHQFPGALVVGFDLVRGKPEHPPGYREVRGNLLQGLPFRDESFDFVHQRFLVAGIPLAAWPGAVRELVRVTRPGGWVELVDSATDLQRAGPVTIRLFDLLRPLGAAAGLDTTSVIFHSLDDYLRRSGVERVTRREEALPVGEWGGRIGSFLATDWRSGLTRLCETMRARSPHLVEEVLILLDQAVQEWERHQSTWPVAIVYGCKPV